MAIDLGKQIRERAEAEGKTEEEVREEFQKMLGNDLHRIPTSMRGGGRNLLASVNLDAINPEVPKGDGTCSSELAMVGLEVYHDILKVINQEAEITPDVFRSLFPKYFNGYLTIQRACGFF